MNFLARMLGATMENEVMLQDTSAVAALGAQDSNAIIEEMCKSKPPGYVEAKKKLRWLINGKEPAARMKIDRAMQVAMMERNVSEEWHNRPRSSYALKRYERSMKRGWPYTGETIIFSENGRLLNGQHRLVAAFNANVSFDCLVAFGVDDDVFQNIDTGCARTAGHIFAIEDIKNSNYSASIARLYYSYTHSITWDGRTLDRIENDELFDFYMENEADIQASYSLGNKVGRTHLLPQRWAGFCYLICANKNRTLANDFFERLATGLNLNKKTEPLYVLRNLLNKDRTGGRGDKEQDVYLAAWTIQAWNSTRSNTSFKHNWREKNIGESFPRAQ